jgi:hypothetical protein
MYFFQKFEDRANHDLFQRSRNKHAYHSHMRLHAEGYIMLEGGNIRCLNLPLWVKFDITDCKMLQAFNIFT